MSVLLSAVLVLVTLQSANDPASVATINLGPSQPAGYSDGDIAALAQDAIVADLRALAFSADEFGRAANRRPDLDIARDVDSMLRKLLKPVPTSLNVSSHRGIVVLRGLAKDEETLRAATEAAAEVPGVRAVLNRMGSPDSAGPLQPVGPTEPDSPPRTEPFAFLTHDGLAGTDVVVDVSDGEIVIEGHANTPKAKFYATTSARRVPGARIVRNNMTVRPISAEDDKRLGILFHIRLQWEQTLHDVADDLEVSVSNGILTLSGQVNTADQASLIRHIAAEAQGVVVVDDRLTLTESDG